MDNDSDVDWPWFATSGAFYLTRSDYQRTDNELKFFETHTRDYLCYYSVPFEILNVILSEMIAA